MAVSDGFLLPDETRHYYYNEDWQVLVEAQDPGNGTLAATAMYAYHQHYVDAVVNRMRESDSHVYLHDANFNVTALLTSSRRKGDRSIFNVNAPCLPRATTPPGIGLAAHSNANGQATTLR